jgi:hypothetical protein
VIRASGLRPLMADAIVPRAIRLTAMKGFEFETDP